MPKLVGAVVPSALPSGVYMGGGGKEPEGA